MRELQPRRILAALVFIIAMSAAVAVSMGIFGHMGPGKFEYKSIRGTSVPIYGEGLYQHMSAEVAPQGIAQDHVTLFIGIPLLIISLVRSLRGSLKGRYLLAGTLAYFLVTYLFYMLMAMYNKLFLLYVVLTGASFYAFLITLRSFDLNELKNTFKENTPVNITGSFLIVCSISIALLWLSIVIPPLLDGTIIPMQVEHYTTLVVQGLDLSILLPAALISGILWIRKTYLGYLLAPVYLIFLSLLMTALTAKVVAMYHLSYPVVPAIFIIPTFNILAIACAVAVLTHIKEPGTKHSAS